jgi:hypothetical protein
VVSCLTSNDQSRLSQIFENRGEEDGYGSGYGSCLSILQTGVKVFLLHVVVLVLFFHVS